MMVETLNDRFDEADAVESVEEKRIRKALKAAGFPRGFVDNLLGCWRTYGIKHVHKDMFGHDEPRKGRPPKYDSVLIVDAVVSHLDYKESLPTAFADVAFKMVGKMAKDVETVENIYKKRKAEAEEEAEKTGKSVEISQLREWFKIEDI